METAGPHTRNESPGNDRGDMGAGPRDQPTKNPVQDLRFDLKSSPINQSPRCSGQLARGDNRRFRIEPERLASEQLVTFDRKQETLPQVRRDVPALVGCASSGVNRRGVGHLPEKWKHRSKLFVRFRADTYVSPFPADMTDTVVSLPGSTCRHP